MDTPFSHRQQLPAEQKLMVVSHTHWDREWYLPFQEFRVRLVRLIDLLLDIMSADPSYAHFTLDGQTIILEDYLEVRPERESEIKGLVKAGRLQVGPWYVIPDEFLVGGESLIRNLIIGHRQAQHLGQVMKVGYLPDPFGHIAQLPQILRGFGIDSAVLWRGVGTKVKNSEFLWRAPDGSEVLVIYTPRGYDNAAVLPLSTAQLMEAIKDIRETLTPFATTEYLLLLNGDDHLEPQPALPRLISAANKRLKDAKLIHGTLPDLVDGIRRTAARDHIVWQKVEGELRSAELAHILAGVLSTRIDIKQRNAAAETLLTKWAEPFSVFAETLAVRLARQPQPVAWIPLLRLAWRYLLQNHPHDSICGCSVDQVHRDIQTRFDWTEEIGEAITKQALTTIASNVNTAAVPKPSGYQSLSAETRAGAEAADLGYVLVFNPETGPRSDFVEVPIQLPTADADLAIADHEGNLLPYQVLRRRPGELYSQTFRREQVEGYLRVAGLSGGWPMWKIRLLEGMAKRLLKDKVPPLAITDVAISRGQDARTVDVEVQMGHGQHNYQSIASALRQITPLSQLGEVNFFRVRLTRQDEADIGFMAPNVPSHGYRVFQLLAGQRRRVAMPVEGISSTIQNDSLSVHVDPQDGTLTVLDKETGVTFQGLNAFVDGGDAGDEYTFSPPAEDVIVDKPGEPPSITLVDAGPGRFTLRIQQRYLLPEALTSDRRARSSTLVPCSIISYVSLYPGLKRIDVRTEVENSAKDHRLRVLMPVPIKVTHSHAEGHFAVIARPVEVSAAQEDWLEHPVGSYPQKSFVSISDGQLGFTVANRGLPEFEVILGDRDTTVALTLLRCVGWLSRDDLATRRGSAGPILPTPGAQMAGRCVFEYALLPHSGGWETVFHQAHWFANPMRAVRTHAHGGLLPAVASFIDVQPPTVVVSAIKPTEEGEGFVVRCFNIIDSPVTAQISILNRLARAERVSLNEESQGDWPLNDDHTIYLPLRGHEIATLRLHLATEGEGVGAQSLS